MLNCLFVAINTWYTYMLQGYRKWDILGVIITMVTYQQNTGLLQCTISAIVLTLNLNLLYGHVLKIVKQVSKPFSTVRFKQYFVEYLVLGRFLFVNHEITQNIKDCCEFCHITHILKLTKL
ncbi:hypothetical protein KUTeg_019847 [Tegillarca granosa]|uniref:Uncharacterized protein n=1 Tax=Tegillarca granosa TaxID=220873 RepID=A0ABQ9EGA2_TEGGR|nr:hypothetical protein KUTeg_019847 [Tegillarca granosa]